MRDSIEVTQAYQDIKKPNDFICRHSPAENERKSMIREKYLCPRNSLRYDHFFKDELKQEIEIA